MHAQAQDWKRVPAPQQTAPLNFQALFTDAEAEQMRQGIIPKQMEDKWFIYFEDGWLRFHRSWTGFFYLCAETGWFIRWRPSNRFMG
ncbi:hypothetical protein [Pectobacterium peruviense]|uniref:hypothetical protein n=1 Tax=Pectobacterium peruviense TaxID=2066479 RepID=UPI001CB948C1|nr:hypothetical protein [Pectobacterium peruviense]